MKIIKFLINIIVLFFTLIIPKTRKIVIVGGWFGDRFADNSKAMYEYLFKNKDKLGLKRVIWYTNSKDIYNNLEAQGYDVIIGISAKNIYLHLRSKVHIIDQSSRDILGFLSVRSIRINLWHGFPLKRIGTYTNDKKAQRNKWTKYYTLGYWTDCYLLTTSHLSRKVLSKAFGLPEDKCIVSSYPRTENLYDNRINNSEFRIFYLPTYRNDEKTNPILSLNLVEINDLLNKNNIVFYVKPHFASLDLWQDRQYSNFKILDAKSDVYDTLDKSDLLISDYSSVIFDFLLTDRPILLFPYDYKDYVNGDRGFTVDYNEYTPGAKIYDVNELFDKIVFIKNNTDEYFNQYSEQYEKVKKLLFRYTDEYNYDEIIHLIKGKANS